MNFLRTLLRKELFFPSLLGLLVNPFYFARKGLANAMKKAAPTLKGKLLDVGCGTMPYRSLFAVDCYIGLDIDTPHTRALAQANYYYDGSQFPIANASFDAVLCNQVLEHVFTPDSFLQEIVRVLKPNGHLLLTVPFIWDEHEQPYDFARYTSFGLRHLFEKNGLRIIKQQKIGDDLSVIFQLINAYLYKIFVHRPAIIRIIATVTLMATVNILGLLVSWLMPKNPDLYLDHLILAEKLP